MADQLTLPLPGVYEVAGVRFPYVLDPVTGCWLCTHSVNPDGYARKRHGKRVRAAHRVLYELLHGEPPAEWVVDHVYERGCRSRRCINPAHLEAVPPVVNVQRGASATLDTLAVLAIFEIRHDGYSAREVAASFGVEPEEVRRIWRGQRWSNVTGPAAHVEAQGAPVTL